MDLITNPSKQNLDGYGYVVASGWVSRPFRIPRIAYIQHAAYTIAYLFVVGYNFHADAND